MQVQLQQALEKLIGLPLTRTTRNELVQYFHFGHTHYTTSQGLILDVGVFVLAVNCPWQLTQVQTTIKHNEVFMRKREAGLPTGKFDWKVAGANLRDQRLKEFIGANPSLEVITVQVGEQNEFVVQFSNNTAVTVTPDPAKEQDLDWQLFSNTDDTFSITAGKAGIR